MWTGPIVIVELAIMAMPVVIVDYAAKLMALLGWS